MSSTKSRLIPSAAVTSLAGAGVLTCLAFSVVVGSLVRQNVDMGGTARGSSMSGGVSLTGLLASRDTDVPEGDFFREMVRLLKREYVEPITDDRKLAVGAVKGMVNSLKDPRSMFMDTDEFRVYQNSLQGKYEGIGADFTFKMQGGKPHNSATGADSASPNDMGSLSIPRLTVVGVTPGGPAEQAGVKPGDWVDTIEDHWVLGPDLVSEYRTAVVQATTNATKSLPLDEAKKRRDKARSLGAQLRAKLNTMVMPLKARDMLTIGEGQTVKVLWRRGGAVRETAIQKKASQIPLVEGDG
ncbi:MAG: carboxyl-terminal processing protease, partial [Fimbriimonadaceae bacterium]|nr:carboxyl-terminal processing protease [Fimbriimonadaceae bacterium]